jgi:hypothetical protein
MICRMTVYSCVSQTSIAASNSASAFVCAFSSGAVGVAPSGVGGFGAGVLISDLSTLSDSKGLTD